MHAGRQRPLAPEDLYRLQRITDCRLSPDGAHVVYAVQRIDRATEKKRSNLWVVPTRGGRPRQFTWGEHVDASPRWSPDGEAIAFLSNRRDEKKPQIHVLPFRGGEARPLTDLQGTFGSFAWSPDGTRLVVQFRRKDAEEIAREADPKKKERGIVARHVTRAFFKLDGEGYLPKERWHLVVVDVQSGRVTHLTDGEVHDEADPAWTPDGRSVVFVSNRTPDPDLDPDAVDLFVVPARGGKPRRIEAPVGPKSLPSVSPDGRRVAYLGTEGRGEWWRNLSLWVVPIDGSAPARNLTAAHDLHAASWTINDFGELPLLAPTWLAGGQRLAFQTIRRGNTELLSIGLDGTGLAPVVADPGVVGAYGFDREEKVVACFFGEATDPGQVRVRDLATGRVRVLTALNRRLLSRIDLGAVEEVAFEGPGGYPLQGWVVRPPRSVRRRAHPAIVYIHGGPRVQYGRFFMHEFFVLAGRGYVVGFSNPRGGQGYGEAHSKAIHDAWGTVDYEDVMAFADRVASLPYVDGDRLGVAGGSYGGYMTNWIVGHTDRFRAAVTQRSVSNLLSMWGSSDFNWTFQEEIGRAPPWESFEKMWERSPMKHIGAAKTPTLVLHNEQDLRCAIEQGEQVFVALKRLGVPTEMVRFPDEPHGLSRTGRTDRRIARLGHILRWFDRYLGTGPRRATAGRTSRP